VRQTHSFSVARVAANPPVNRDARAIIALLNGRAARARYWER
jgi:hypothetical protein